MTAAELERIVHLEPFKPYRVVLSSGERVLVHKPRKSHVSGDVLSLVGKVSKGKSTGAVEKFRIIRVDQIVSAEHVDLPAGI